MGEVTNFRDYQRRLDEAEIVSPGDLKRVSTWLGILTGSKRLPTGSEIIDFGRRKAERAVKRRVRNVGIGIGRHITDSVFGEKYGKIAFDKFYDINAYRIVKEATQRYLSGDSEIYFVPVEDELRYKGKPVLGCHNRKTAFYRADPQSALGTLYDSVLKKSGLSKEQFDEAFREYVKIHENNEAYYQNATLQDELDEEEHGKLEAYTLKALKYAGERTKNIYKVGVLIDSLRNDDFGEKIRKYADPDVRADFKYLNRYD